LPGNITGFHEEQYPELRNFNGLLEASFKLQKDANVPLKYSDFGILHNMLICFRHCLQYMLEN